MINTKAIRDRILLLALKGELVEQNPQDAPASDLIDELCRKMADRSFEPDFSEDEIPYDIPSSWSWCRLSDIGSTNIGLTYHPEDVTENGVIVARSGNIINGKMDYSDLVKVSCNIRENQYLNNNDILICARNGSKALVGKCAIYEGDSKTIAFGAFMAVFRTPLFRYAYYYFNTDVFKRNFISDDSKQINQVTQNILKQSLIPIPPISEQTRIVERIEAVFEILDKIDALQEQYASNKEVLKSKLIEAAIQGKLTEQLPEDGTAEELIQSIQKEKQTLVKAGKIKREKTLPEISKDEIPFDIPTNWKWVRVNDIGSWSSGATPSRSNPSYYTNGTIPWIKTGELNDGVIVDAEEYITDTAFKESSVRLNPIGSVLIAMYGATIGKVAILDIEATTNQACCACIPIEIDNKYLFYFLKNNKRNFLAASHGGAQPNISKDIITKSLMPLPPVKEQKRIVERLDALLNALK